MPSDTLYDRKYQDLDVISRSFYMSTALNIEDILSQVRKLDKDKQFALLERLVALIRKSDENSRKSKLSSISGIGSEIWRDTDIDNYIDRERQW